MPAKSIDVKNDCGQSAKTSLFSNLNFGIFPALIVAVLPKCPLCLTAYLSALGFVGISPLQYGFWILPLMIFFPAITVIMFFRQARRRAKYYPFFLSLISLIFISVGKFYLEYNPLIYIGAGILIVSAIRLSRAERPIQCNNC